MTQIWNYWKQQYEGFKTRAMGITKGHTRTDYIN